MAGECYACQFHDHLHCMNRYSLDRWTCYCDTCAQIKADAENDREERGEDDGDGCEK